MKIKKQPSSQELSIAVMALKNCFEGLSEDSLFKALKDYGRGTKEKELMTVKEAAEKFCVAVDTIYRLMHSGELKALRITDRGRGGRPEYRIYRSSYLEYLHKREADSAATEPAR